VESVFSGSTCPFPGSVRCSGAARYQVCTFKGRLLPTNVFLPIRFIVLRSSEYARIKSRCARALPNLRAIIEQDWSPSPESGKPAPPPHSVGLHILRSTDLVTISSILDQRLFWRYAAAQKRESCVRSISSINIGEGATLHIGDPTSYILFMPVQEKSTLSVSLPSSDLSGSVTTSMNAIRKMVLCPESAMNLLQLNCVIGQFGPSDAAFWIDQVR
jgi:hypothetical protein